MGQSISNTIIRNKCMHTEQFRIFPIMLYVPSFFLNFFRGNALFTLVITFSHTIFVGKSNESYHDPQTRLTTGLVN